jgi:hypothetical protein
VQYNYDVMEWSEGFLICQEYEDTIIHTDNNAFLLVDFLLELLSKMCQLSLEKSFLIPSLALPELLKPEPEH